MKRGFQYLIWMFLFSSPLCAKDFLLPHVADGWFAGGIIRMTVIYLNPATDVVTAELILTRDDGSPLQVTISGLGPGSRFTLTLQPGETRILQTDGSGALAAGAARITATGDIGVSGVFTIFDVNRPLRLLFPGLAPTAASAWFFPREDRSSSQPLPWAP